MRRTPSLEISWPWQGYPERRPSDHIPLARRLCFCFLSWRGRLSWRPLSFFEQISLTSEYSPYVGFILLRRIRDLGDTECLAQLRSQRLHTYLRKELVKPFPAFIAGGADGLRKLINLAVALCERLPPVRGAPDLPRQLARSREAFVSLQFRSISGPVPQLAN